MSSRNAAPLPRLVPGSICDRYVLVDTIGSGGMGTVYEAIHTTLGTRVAVKVVRTSAKLDEEWSTRFLEEARALARIEHPNVVRVLDIGRCDGVEFYVMELLRGESLADTMARVGAMSARQAASIALPIASALDAVHRAGIVHHDVKPENIFIAWDEHGHATPKLVDFGVAVDLALPPRGVRSPMIGTPAYMAPEQVRGHSTDARVDQYALGVVLYQMLTDRAPFEGDSIVDLMTRIDDGEFTKLRDVRSTIDPLVAEVVERAFTLDPSARFENCIELARALYPMADRRVRALHALELDITETGIESAVSDPFASEPLTPPSLDRISSIRARAILPPPTPESELSRSGDPFVSVTTDLDAPRFEVETRSLRGPCRKRHMNQVHRATCFLFFVALVAGSTAFAIARTRRAIERTPSDIAKVSSPKLQVESEER